MTDEPQRRDAAVARRAFDTIAAAQKVATIPELNNVFGVNLERLGFDHFLGATAMEGPQGAEVSILFGANHKAWEAHYQRLGYARHDAVLREMLLTGEPLFWSDLPKRGTVSTLGQQILCEAREFGLFNGFATPIFHVDGSISTILLMGQDIDDKDPDLRAAAHLMSLYYGSISRRLGRGSLNGGATPILSPRQLECLRWVRHGKSSTDIGDILGLSTHTVNEYIANACARLGVRTRTQAVAEAAIHGILEL